MVSYQQINPEREKTYMTVQFPKGLVLAILHTLYTVEGSDFLSELGLSRAKSHTVLAVFLIYLFQEKVLRRRSTKLLERLLRDIIIF